MELNDYDKSRTRFHLGYNTGANLPAGDIARLEEALARVPDSYFYDRIIEHLNRCDKVYRLSQIFKTESAPQPNMVQRITGDTDRQIMQSDPIKADKTYREVYLREVDRLAETLYVANYRRDEVRRYAFDRSGSEYIMAIKGPADTAVGTRIAQAVGSQNWR